jgi:hypothetical protein
MPPNRRPTSDRRRGTYLPPHVSQPEWPMRWWGVSAAPLTSLPSAVAHLLLTPLPVTEAVIALSRYLPQCCPLVASRALSSTFDYQATSAPTFHCILLFLLLLRSLLFVVSPSSCSKGLASKRPCELVSASPIMLVHLADHYPPARILAWSQDRVCTYTP